MRRFLLSSIGFISCFAALAAPAGAAAIRSDSRQIIGQRPAGCPHAWCGCGLRKYLGIADERFDVAWNWARFFPHTFEHSGAVAVRHGHVFLLERQVSGSLWVVDDFNWNCGLAWRHVRDVRGYVFVEPRRQFAGGL